MVGRLDSRLVGRCYSDFAGLLVAPLDVPLDDVLFDDVLAALELTDPLETLLPAEPLPEELLPEDDVPPPEEDVSPAALVDADPALLEPEPELESVL
jgi:hypothetical protein